MSRRYPSRRRATGRNGTMPLVGFLLVASFGILFAGCNGPESVPEDSLVFTQDDVARFRELAQASASGDLAGSGEVTDIEPIGSGTGSSRSNTIDLDLSMLETYNSLRSQAGAEGNMFIVNNDFVNVRSQTSAASKSVGSLTRGAPLEVLEFTDGQWAKVRIPGGAEGYVFQRYIAKVTTEEKLEEEKKQFENMYYVSFGFVNVRAEPVQSSQKLGEIPGNKIVRPLSIEGDWAKVTFEGREGYVSTSYLAPFMPNFVARQDTFNLPVLHYHMTADQAAETLAAMSAHINKLRTEGYTFITLAAFRDTLLAQQQRDVKLDPKRIVVAVTGITPENLKDVSDTLNTNGINATLFLETQHVGVSGITEKRVITLMANGFDVQSGTHTGDDLRAQTNAQVELEMRQSRKILEEMTKKPVFAVAYPQGGVNDRVANIAAQAGYLFGMGDNADPSFTRGQLLRLPAMTVFPSMTPEEIVEFVTDAQ